MLIQKPLPFLSRTRRTKRQRQGRDKSLCDKGSRDQERTKKQRKDKKHSAIYKKRGQTRISRMRVFHGETNSRYVHVNRATLTSTRHRKDKAETTASNVTIGTDDDNVDTANTAIALANQDESEEFRNK
jgi:hypothetical protein